ncbi:hypothetical protein ATN83_2594 [Raoultella ornithinolytica]|nr:hypothetical protein ATN83_2594 [Raoultella ornithinolytica]KDV94305.1 hypothetical protein AB00_2449 [Raoultella ornithinolytica 2-156-04_S1_C1]
MEQFAINIWMSFRTDHHGDFIQRKPCGLSQRNELQFIKHILMVLPAKTISPDRPN